MFDCEKKLRQYSDIMHYVGTLLLVSYYNLMGFFVYVGLLLESAKKLAFVHRPDSWQCVAYIFTGRATSILAFQDIRSIY